MFFNCNSFFRPVIFIVRRIYSNPVVLLLMDIFQSLQGDKIMTRSRRHTFSFEGGDQLTTIGATFFVSYLYHRHVDSTHRNWALIKTQKSRISTINRSENYHSGWLKQISNMSEANLNKNTLGLDGATIKKMALAIQKSI